MYCLITKLSAKTLQFTKSIDCDWTMVWPSIIKTHCSLISSVYHHWCNIWISLPASNCVYAHKSQFKVLKQSVSPTYHCLPHPDFLYKSHLHHIINASSAHCQYKSYHLYSFPKASEPSFTKTKSWWKSNLSCPPH